MFILYLLKIGMESIFLSISNIEDVLNVLKCKLLFKFSFLKY